MISPARSGPVPWSWRQSRRGKVGRIYCSFRQNTRAWRTVGRTDRHLTSAYAALIPSKEAALWLST